MPKQPQCHINPKTDRPFTRHLYEQRNLRVETYTRMASGEEAATGVAFELVCKRCGYQEKVTY